MAPWFELSFRRGIRTHPLTQNGNVYDTAIEHTAIQLENYRHKGHNERQLFFLWTGVEKRIELILHVWGA
jgi:hypothetical protein